MTPKVPKDAHSKLIWYAWNYGITSQVLGQVLGQLERGDSVNLILTNARQTLKLLDITPRPCYDGGQVGKENNSTKAQEKKETG